MTYRRKSPCRKKRSKDLLPGYGGSTSLGYESRLEGSVSSAAANDVQNTAPQPDQHHFIFF